MMVFCIGCMGIVVGCAAVDGCASIVVSDCGSVLSLSNYWPVYSFLDPSATSAAIDLYFRRSFSQRSS